MPALGKGRRMKPTAGPLITCEAVADAMNVLKPTTLKARAEALELQAAQCDKLYPWPALAASFRTDAMRLRAALDRIGRIAA